VPELPPAPAPPEPLVGLGAPTSVPPVGPLVPTPVPEVVLPVTPEDPGVGLKSEEPPVVPEPVDPAVVPSVGRGPPLVLGSCCDLSDAEPQAQSRATRGIDRPKVIE